MRAALAVMTIGAVVLCACRRQDSPGTTEKVELTQNVTVQRKPEDKNLSGFEKRWREFISSSPQLAKPVVIPEPRTDAPRWQPATISECVFSANAGGAVPQVTLRWTDEHAPDASALRFDLAIVRDGFTRNQYSSAIPGMADRFLLPSTSALVANEEAVLLTGPGLFATVTFLRESVADPGSGRPVVGQTLVLRDLSPGLTYSIRLDHAARDGWVEQRRYAFLTPVCPRGA